MCRVRGGERRRRAEQRGRGSNVRAVLGVWETAREREGERGDERNLGCGRQASRCGPCLLDSGPSPLNPEPQPSPPNPKPYAPRPQNTLKLPASFRANGFHFGSISFNTLSPPLRLTGRQGPPRCTPGSEWRPAPHAPPLWVGHRPTRRLVHNPSRPATRRGGGAERAFISAKASASSPRQPPATYRAHPL
jgi:hypothetical protein